MSSKGDEYGTPDDLFAAIRDEFGPFDMDGAANRDNTKLLHFTNDASMTTWDGNIFINPPYSIMPLFAALAVRYVVEGEYTVTMLCRCDPSTEWWRTWVDPFASVYFLSKRVQFIGGDGAYNFPCAIVRYDFPIHGGRYQYFLGWPT